MSHEVLHAFNVRAAGDHHRGCGVAQIMHTGVRRSCFGCNLLMMCIKTLWVQVVAERICENEPTGGVLLGGVYPVLPKITGL